MAFSFYLLDTVRFMQNVNHVSTQGMAEYIVGTFVLTVSRCGGLTAIALQLIPKSTATILSNLSQAMKQYMILKFSIESLSFFQLGALLQSCPACPDGRCSVTMDGNFRLGRRTNASKNDSYSNVGILFFFLDADVTKAACAREPNLPSSLQECSNFQAGSAFRGSSCLDEKGVFCSFCPRREYPLVFTHLFHGERLRYADLVVDAVTKRYQTEKATVFYDIACKYQKHIKNAVSCNVCYLICI